jgi:hypothetical protein
MRNATQGQKSPIKGESPKRTPRRARRLQPSAARRPITEDNLGAEIRRAFFAKGGTLAKRYRITLDQVLAHIEVAEEVAHARTDSGRRLHLSRIPASIEDLILATACCHGIGRAWQDCRDLHAPLLSRACEMRLHEVDALLFVRRFWEDLEATTRGATVAAGPRMQDFLGTRPIRVWLADRLLGRLEYLMREGALEGVARRPEWGEGYENLRLVE